MIEQLFYLNALGFSSQTAENYEAICWASVKLCQEWVQLYCRPAKRINRRVSSYKLKHAVERWSSVKYKDTGWIGNGELIIGALLEGYRVEPILHSSTRKTDPINAVFNVILPTKTAEQADAGLLGMIEVDQKREQG